MDNYKKFTIVKTRYPKNDSDFLDLEKVIDDYIIDQDILPFFSQNSKFITQGSCFAGNLHKYLLANGFESYYEEFTEALNNPLTLDNFFNSIKNNPTGKETLIKRI